jgi:superkiller protein 3
MSTTKAVLKAINDAVKQQKWDNVIETATDFLKKEPKNYNTFVS